MSGIGYFTLPYLVHARASHVHACEWNPDAVEALQKNLEANGVSDRCTIHRGDNRQVTDFSVHVTCYMYCLLTDLCSLVVEISTREKIHSHLLCSHKKKKTRKFHV